MAHKARHKNGAVATELVAAVSIADAKVLLHAVDYHGGHLPRAGTRFSLPVLGIVFCFLPSAFCLLPLQSYPQRDPLRQRLA